MQNSPIVRRCQSSAQLTRDVERLCPVQATDALQERSQVFAIDVFHREKVAAFDFTDIVDSTDVGMRNLPGNAHFRKQPLAPQEGQKL
jgi:hypothetical protein